MRKVLFQKKYSGFIWHILFAGLFIGLSLFLDDLTDGVTWFLISSALRTIFGVAILITGSRLFGKAPPDILSLKNMKGAVAAGSGFLLFFLYDIVTVLSGTGGIRDLSIGILLSKVFLQQLTTGFYEELNYRFLLLEGLKHTRNTTGMKLLFVGISTVLFGLLHCVTGWDTYSFLQTGAIGFAFAVIFVRSGNIVFPMILHFLYDIIAKLTEYIVWDHNLYFESLNSVFEIALAVMFVISFVILVAPDKRNKNKQTQIH